MQTASQHRFEAPVADLQRIFGARLEAVVGYGGHAPDWARSLALVSSLTPDDLAALAAAAPTWHARDIATPLILPRLEFAQSLDAFPLEYGEIIDHHQVLVGTDPFAGVQIAPRDLRRALEARTASHLLHLRENFVELGGNPRAVGVLVRDSAPNLLAILKRLARLDGAAPDTATETAQWASTRLGLDVRVISDVLAFTAEPDPPVDVMRLFPEYVATVEALLRAVDQWPVS